jgi:hypothetical protein
MMHYGLRFDRVTGSRGVRQLGGFMRTHVGTYRPEVHVPWVETVCVPGVESGERWANGWWRDGRLIGACVLKVKEPNVAELKYLRVAAPDGLERRGLGRFIVGQVPFDAVEMLGEAGMITPDANAITVQVDSTEGSSAVPFFKRNGFTEIGSAELYTPGVTEIIMQSEVRL